MELYLYALNLSSYMVLRHRDNFYLLPLLQLIQPTENLGKDTVSCVTPDRARYLPDLVMLSNQLGAAMPPVSGRYERHLVSLWHQSGVSMTPSDLLMVNDL